ncbi:nuclear transport factor 2 family protein [Chitinophaga sp. XS-30]|uniref:nuclear transport factor 2 family protein n=1 Tax=Chitinophaga sp. XS-30 TaxID=2604421 RepID=UPI0011DCBCCC|nr:nuclear transport factor 2 family protein [Chitinophaga sp. XS-30]QEH43449.1 nuclear transport factor 2 family protein [Chitinophaga sp. XS-30]
MGTTALKKVISEKYVHGAFNETDLEAFNSIFHPDFSIINIQEDGSFFRFTRDMWEEVLKQRLENKDFDYSSVAFVPVFKTVAIAGDKAHVMLELLLDGKVVYTDFLLLIRIGGEWKIVSKIYHEHKAG